jgi:hypothetical protein
MNPAEPECEDAIWEEIDKTAPTRVELADLLERFRSEQKIIEYESVIMAP